MLIVNAREGASYHAFVAWHDLCHATRGIGNLGEVEHLKLNRQFVNFLYTISVMHLRQTRMSVLHCTSTYFRHVCDADGMLVCCGGAAVLRHFRHLNTRHRHRASSRAALPYPLVPYTRQPRCLLRRAGWLGNFNAGRGQGHRKEMVFKTCSSGKFNGKNGHFGGN